VVECKRDAKEAQGKFHELLFLNFSTEFNNFQPRCNLNLPTSTMAGTAEFLDAIPKWALVVFAVFGFYGVSSKVISYVRLLLSLFVLPGKNVSKTPLLSSAELIRV
jgi:hypothetical protein